MSSEGRMLGVWLALAACGKARDSAIDSGGTPGDSGHDSGVAGDSGVPRDSGGDHDSGVADSGAHDSGGAATFDDAYAILRTRCVSCHDGAGFPYGDFDLRTPDQAYAGLVGVEATSQFCAGTGYVLVVPGDPSTSVLYTKIAGDPMCGGAMPWHEAGPPPDPVPADELATIAAWITAGALDD